jgi:hypothetical protein
VTRLKLEKFRDSSRRLLQLRCKISAPAGVTPDRVVHNGGRREDFASAARTKAVQPL